MKWCASAPSSRSIQCTQLSCWITVREITRKFSVSPIKQENPNRWKLSSLPGVSLRQFYRVEWDQRESLNTGWKPIQVSWDGGDLESFSGWNTASHTVDITGVELNTLLTHRSELVSPRSSLTVKPIRVERWEMHCHSWERVYLFSSKSPWDIV